MANFCVLCDAKLSFFGGKSLICANQEQSLCSSCYDTLDRMDNVERGKYLLEHGKPDEPEAMKQFITVWEERAAQKKALEPPTRVCPNCGGEMELKIKNFRIGMDGGGGLASSLLYDQYDVDLYACPECGKVEMYTANFAAIKARQDKLEAEKAAAEAARQARQPEQEFVSVRPGKKDGAKPPWER